MGGYFVMLLVNGDSQPVGGVLQVSLASPWVQQCEQMVRGISGVLYNPAGSAVATGPVGVFRGGKRSPAILWLSDWPVLSCPAHCWTGSTLKDWGVPKRFTFMRWCRPHQAFVTSVVLFTLQLIAWLTNAHLLHIKLGDHSFIPFLCLKAFFVFQMPLDLFQCLGYVTRPWFLCKTSGKP